MKIPILRKIKMMLFLSLLTLISGFFVLFPQLVLAGTNITDGELYEGAVWTKENSPYILEDTVKIPEDQKLVIEKGVTVTSAPVSEGNDPYSIRIWGDLEIIGTKEDPVHIDGLGEISLGKNNRIENTIFERTGLNAGPGTTTISNSKISGAFVAIYASKSVIDIVDSEISGNSEGIFSSHWDSGPFPSLMARIGPEAGTGEIDPDQNVITIKNTVIENNQEFAIKNRNSNVIQASDNWWGDPAGPGENISGPIEAAPWKTEDPRLHEAPVCCSNVLFLPGFEASRLYRPGLVGENTLWEPNRNDDVRKLYLNEDGKSLDDSVYTYDLLDSAFGLKNIYKKFIAMMDGVVADKIINEWTPFAYDWRMDVDSVANGNTKYSTTTKRLIEEVERLAKTSKTGRVTIVAHSNGGLLAKTLGRALDDQGKSFLIDRVLFVAVPQLGTPQAIAGILHGDNQSILSGAVLSGGVARTMGINMPGAYGLLPSEEYLKRFIDPVITLAGNAVDAYQNFYDFLTGKSDNRSQPAESDLKNPAVLNDNILNDAKNIHQKIDNWKFPTFTDVISLVGWGMPTTKTLAYSGEASSSPKIVKTSGGDGTVLSESAGSYEGQELYFNQGLSNHDNKSSYLHADILEADSVRSFISNFISTPSQTASVSSIQLPKYISPSKPNPLDYPWMSWITVSVHSPVDIDVYDSHGGHIGLIPLPNHPDSDIKWLENTIGGQYESIGDEKYITVPADDVYSIQLKGTGVGSFTFQVEKFLGGDMAEVASTTYADLPVTPLLTASTSINSLMINPILNLDFDGNGAADIQIKPNATSSPMIYLDSIKTIVLSLKLKTDVENDILKKIEKVRILIQKDKSTQVLKKIKAIEDKIMNRHWNLKKLAESDRQMLAGIIVNLLNSLN